eukprot:TRINITY_DN32746_c0_g1_i1.p1 TRINITY_DN32746_c0_g1~~TRINITY_DN32746_c0_g1_i1.p1  ORF type:complete len:565 (+),score=133.58 TRINITY_DN32746_c0_g1_i1:103-1797(+)
MPDSLGHKTPHRASQVRKEHSLESAADRLSDFALLAVSGIAGVGLLVPALVDGDVAKTVCGLLLLLMVGLRCTARSVYHWRYSRRERNRLAAVVAGSDSLSDREGDDVEAAHGGGCLAGNAGLSASTAWLAAAVTSAERSASSSSSSCATALQGGSLAYPGAVAEFPVAFPPRTQTRDVAAVACVQAAEQAVQTEEVLRTTRDASTSPTASSSSSESRCRNGEPPLKTARMWRLASRLARAQRLLAERAVAHHLSSRCGADEPTSSASSQPPQVAEDAQAPPTNSAGDAKSTALQEVQTSVGESPQAAAADAIKAKLAQLATLDPVAKEKLATKLRDAIDQRMASPPRPNSAGTATAACLGVQAATEASPSADVGPPTVAATGGSGETVGDAGAADATGGSCCGNSSPAAARLGPSGAAKAVAEKLQKLSVENQELRAEKDACERQRDDTKAELKRAQKLAAAKALGPKGTGPKLTLCWAADGRYRSAMARGVEELQGSLAAGSKDAELTLGAPPADWRAWMQIGLRRGQPSDPVWLQLLVTGADSEDSYIGLLWRGATDAAMC